MLAEEAASARQREVLECRLGSCDALLGLFFDPGDGAAFQPFSNITSVDLITAETLSPTFSFISSALRFVITLSIKFFPARMTTWAMTPPNWISTTSPSRRFRADRVMAQSIRLVIRGVQRETNCLVNRLWAGA